jgi:hypothetical protein
MRQTINVLVVEDNEYYNNLILNALRQSIHFMQKRLKFRLILHSFTDAIDCIKKIESSIFKNNDVVAFVDQNLGMGVYGNHILGLLKKGNNNTLGVILLQSPTEDQKCIHNNYDFFVLKDIFAPALCRLYLDQYIENKFL